MVAGFTGDIIVPLPQYKDSRQSENSNGIPRKKKNGHKIDDFMQDCSISS